MGAVLMAWGPFLFEVGRAAYEKIERDVKPRWKDHEIIGRRVAGQFVGPGKLSVVIAGTIYPDVTGASSVATVRGIEAAADAGEVYELVSMDGTIFGPHRLVKGKSVGEYIGPDGAPQKLSYTLTFELHSDDGGPVVAMWPA